MSLCVFFTEYPKSFDLLMGLLWGGVALSLVLVLFNPVPVFIDVPSHLFLDLIFYYIFNVIYRVLKLGASAIIPILIAFQVVDMGVLKPADLSCPSIGSPSELGLGLIIAAIAWVWESILVVLFLDHYFRFREWEIPRTLSSGETNRQHPIEMLKKAQNQGKLNPPIPDSFLERIRFGVIPNKKEGRTIVYGGVFFRPRVLLPTALPTKETDLFLPVVLNAIAHLRQGDSFLSGLVTAIGQAFPKKDNLLSRIHDVLAEICCDTFALTTVPPEWVVRTLCAFKGDFREFPSDDRAFHLQTVELIEKHGADSRIAWAAQFCDGGGYFGASHFWKRRLKIPTVLTALLVGGVVLALAVPFLRELEAGIAYHTVWVESHPAPQ